MPDEVSRRSAGPALNAQLRGNPGATFRSGLVRRPAVEALGEFLGTTAKFRYWFRIITRLPMI